MDSGPPLPLAVMVSFTHASVQATCEEHGLDVLHIKGPALDQALLGRHPPSDGDEAGATLRVLERHSGDADILVRPSQVSRFLDVVAAQGWDLLFDFADGSSFEHAATLRHQVLGYLDVHRRFPGIRRDAEEAFDLLWQHRATQLIAEYGCPVPSVSAQRLVLILHAARGGSVDSEDITRAWWDATEEQRADVDRIAGELDATVALAAGTRRLASFVNDPDYALWRNLIEGRPSLVELWWARVRSARSLREAVRIAIRTALPNPRRISDRLSPPPTRRALFLSLVGRIRRAGRDLAHSRRRRRR